MGNRAALLLGVATLFAVATFAGCGTTAASPAGASPPVNQVKGVSEETAELEIVGLSVSPAALPVSGGDVTLTASVSDGRVVTKVVFTVVDSAGESVELEGALVEGDFSAVFSAPPNLGSVPQPYSVSATAIDEDSALSQPRVMPFVVASALIPPPPPGEEA